MLDFTFKYVVKDADGKISLETLIQENAVERAKQEGYKLLKVPMIR